MSAHQHWETVYHTKDSAQVSWYTPHLETSLQLIKRLAPSPQASILDVGSGASTLPDDLLVAGYQNLSVLDISEQALELAQTRLGDQAVQVNWLVGDVLELEFAPHSFDIWHDRAVFHFLTEKAQRERYV
ncbi:class I SAM-dependent methyltransferase [uncultured Thiothrix sp.]|uniref:class I SAM-dependent methyltransferase n=1 Tax=uncultured Thiothrix sp. TaxID=223185 RepID=UPI002615E826|nr:class I SAM-dependent methyltransferase [uncultured Thiothrix sp.]